MIARRYIVTGRVQGVGFRYFTHRVAQQLGVRGRVTNLPNGTVEVYAEGDKDPMEQFLTGIKKGPSLGFVKDVEVGEAEPEGYPDFSREACPSFGPVRNPRSDCKRGLAQK